ncbi:hypothetical protein [Pseudomonas oryzihabitans]|uniref:hypothetical protein n=1 Tax=Pseudomonas oryzihabitans TaxID=47885 RepID=UPI00111552E1|nr:hypothetical protein [Pseudomonas psychrotolerans]
MLLVPSGPFRHTERDTVPDHLLRLTRPDAPEIKIRDYYAININEHRGELLIAKEARYSTSSLRADMRTVDSSNIQREWEFKLTADYRALGQIITYVALARQESNFSIQIRGVLAAFEFTPEVQLANEIMNLGIELLILPETMRAAGNIPRRSALAINTPNIPKFEINMESTPAC